MNKIIEMLKNFMRCFPNPFHIDAWDFGGWGVYYFYSFFPLQDEMGFIKASTPRFVVNIDKRMPEGELKNSLQKSFLAKIYWMVFDIWYFLNNIKFKLILTFPFFVIGYILGSICKAVYNGWKKS